LIVWSSKLLMISIEKFVDMVQGFAVFLSKHGSDQEKTFLSFLFCCYTHGDRLIKLDKHTIRAI
jgi:hypothetical protein